MTQLDRPPICCIPVVVSRHAAGAARRAPERLRPLVPRTQNRPPGDALAAGYPQGVRWLTDASPEELARYRTRKCVCDDAPAGSAEGERGSLQRPRSQARRRGLGRAFSLRGASSSPTPIALTRTERVPPSSSATDTAIVVCPQTSPDPNRPLPRSSAHAGSSPTSDPLAYGQPPPGAGAEATTTWPAVWSNMLVGPLHWLAAMKSVSRRGPPSAQAKHPRSS